MDLSRLNDKEKEQLYNLLAKANGETDQSNTNVDASNENREWGQAPPPNPPTVRRILPKEEWINKQIATLEAVGKENYLTGIKNPRKDPIKAGIDAQKRYEEQMKKDDVLKRREMGLKATNMDEWASMCEKIGADKLVDGVKARQYKIERFLDKYIPALEKHLADIDAMPNVTDADREKRMIANLRGLKKLKRLHKA